MGNKGTRKRYRSRVTASVHETGEGLTGAGVINKQMMREFDAGGQNGLDGVA